MSQLFNDLVSGLNEAIESERGNIPLKKTALTIEPIKLYEKERIRDIRNSAGMTQASFARYMGVSPKTVEAWERGTNIPGGSACRLLEILDSGLGFQLPFIKTGNKI